MLSSKRLAIMTALVSFFLVCGNGLAGELDPPAEPSEAGSAMFSFDDLYKRLDTGEAGEKRGGGFTEPTGPPDSTGHTTDEIMSKMPEVDNVNGASASDVLEGKKFWGLKDGEWGPQEGTMPNNGGLTITPGKDEQAIAAGYHDGSGLVPGHGYDQTMIDTNFTNHLPLYDMVGGRVWGIFGCPDCDGCITTAVSEGCWDRDLCVIECRRYTHDAGGIECSSYCNRMLDSDDGDQQPSKICNFLLSCP